MSEYTTQITKGGQLNIINKIPKTPFIIETGMEKYFIFVDCSNNDEYICAGLDGNYYGAYTRDQILNFLNDNWKLCKSQLIIE
jgi:hypothetical protein